MLEDLIKVAGKISAKLKYLELITFGLKLLSEEDVEEIRRDFSNKNLNELCLEILTKWKGSKDHAEWDDVVGALRKIDKHEVATIIEEARQLSSTQFGKQPADGQGKILSSLIDVHMRTEFMQGTCLLPIITSNSWIAVCFS